MVSAVTGRRIDDLGLDIIPSLMCINKEVHIGSRQSSSRCERMVGIPFIRTWVKAFGLEAVNWLDNVGKPGNKMMIVVEELYTCLKVFK